eukprot:COSAG02_NODE_1521_length_12162_cov_3.464147_12_plen_92_part_00
MRAMSWIAHVRQDFRLPAPNRCYFFEAIFERERSSFTQSKTPRNPALVLSTVCAVVWVRMDTEQHAAREGWVRASSLPECVALAAWRRETG